MDEKSKQFVEQCLFKLWHTLNLDTPSNWDDILEFVIDDVTSASGYLLDGYFNSEDVGIAFRRFIEEKTFEKCFSRCCG